MLEHFETRAQKAVFLGMLAVLTSATALSLVSVVSELRQPSPGFVVWSNLVVPAIGTSSWPGQRAGVPLRSVLVSADGRPLRDAEELRALVRSLPLGTRVTYVFRRDDNTWRVTVPTTSLGWRHVVPAYAGYVVAGIAFLATALITFYFRPSLPAARATLSLGAVLGLTLILALDLFSRFWLERLYFCVESLMPAALLHVALCFPEEKGLVRRHPNLRWMVYLPFVPLALLQNFLLTRNAQAQLDVNDWVYTATAAAGLVTFVSLVHTFRTATTPRVRQQAKVVLGAAAGAAFVPSLGLLSITLLGLQLPMNLLAPFFVLYPLSMAYAIARHDLFSVDRYLRLGVVYAALSLAIVVPYALLVIAVERWVGAEVGLEYGVIPLYLFAAVLLFDPLRSRIQSLVDRLFYRQAYSYRGAVEATSRTLASVLDTAVVARTLLSTLTEVMAIEWAVLLLFEAADGGARGFGQPRGKLDACLARFPEGDATLAALTHRIGPLPELGAELVLPVRLRERPLGALLVGARRSGAHYTDDDLDLLETLANQTALALTNARAYELLRRTQASLVEAERMAAVGELAAAVAHGIRNPLAGIRGTAQVVREDVDGQSRLARDLDNILSEADRLERRVRSILDLARPVEVQMEAHDLNEFLRRFAAALTPRLPAAVHLLLDLADDLPAVAFDTARLDEVVETIVVNAVEAMQGEGTVVVRTAAQTQANEPRVVVSFIDTGPGIPPAAVGRVFDLFYTSKPTGTGMGLAMAKRLVERQGATITAANAPGGGAVISISLRVAAALTARSA